MFQADKSYNLNKINLKADGDVYHIEKTLNLADKKYVVT